MNRLSFAMVIRLLVCAILVLLGRAALNAQNSPFPASLKLIVPLTSTIDDVKNILGRAKKSYANIDEFELENGFVTIEYSTGECISRLSAYTTKKGTVEFVNFQFKEPTDLKILQPDLRDFKTEESNDTPNEGYRNTKIGVEYDTYVKYDDRKNYRNFLRLVNSVYIFPPQQFSNLECRPVKTEKSEH